MWLETKITLKNYVPLLCTNDKFPEKEIREVPSVLQVGMPWIVDTNLGQAFLNRKCGVDGSDIGLEGEEGKMWSGCKTHKIKVYTLSQKK